MTQVIGFFLFLGIILGVEVLVRWRASRRGTSMAALEASANAALLRASQVATRRASIIAAATSTPPAPPGWKDDDVTPVITLHPRKAPRVPTEYRVRPAKKST